MNKRKEIKTQVKKYLLGNTNAGKRVYANRFLPLDDQDENAFPAILIHCGEEQAEERDTMSQKRTAKVYVECIVKGVTADSALDDLVTQAEDILALHGTLDGVIGNEGTFFLTDGEFGIDETKKSILAWRMTFEAVYYADYPGPDAVSWDKAHITLEHDGNTVFAEDVELSK